MYLHYTRKILDKALNQLKWYGRANVHPETVIPYPKTNELTAALGNLISAVASEHPNEAGLLQRCLPQLVTHKYPNGVWFNAYVLGEIIAIVNVLDGLYEEKPKIFISHSSADKEIVKAFVEKILMLGGGFEKDEIFCTLDADAIELGDDFRNSIIDNMRCCDYIFLMISENYRKSEICHNEVGAAWALQGTKRVIPLKFPNISFSQEDLGVLNVVKQAGSLDNKQQIIKIYEELCKVYDIRPDLSRFVQHMDDFIEIVNKQKSAVEMGVKAKKEQHNLLLDSLSDFDKKRLLEWVKSGESSGSCTTTADGTYYELGTVVYPINTGREKSEFADFIERLKKINFVKFTGSDDFSYYYELKKAAYDYVDKMHK